MYLRHEVANNADIQTSETNGVVEWMVAYPRKIGTVLYTLIALLAVKKLSS